MPTGLGDATSAALPACPTIVQIVTRAEGGSLRKGGRGKPQSWVAVQFLRLRRQRELAAREGHDDGCRTEGVVEWTVQALDSP